ncbi:hypothetical protein CEXT_199081 [Caerostris extrusa]|uniref:Uncharacterized protein n=1 Tax=Caerostris extrusa TaxID=172846 RepID=A0AAV4WSF6_CAEEX|nr:hypothetical protein CEXT_199081 [Caerostris extrusa]
MYTELPSPYIQSNLRWRHIVPPSNPRNTMYLRRVEGVAQKQITVVKRNESFKGVKKKRRALLRNVKDDIKDDTRGHDKVDKLCKNVAGVQVLAGALPGWGWGAPVITAAAVTGVLISEGATNDRSAVHASRSTDPLMGRSNRSGPPLCQARV